MDYRKVQVIFAPGQVQIDADGYIDSVFEDASIEILNENMEKVSCGDEGMIFLGGKRISRGYLNRPDLTAEKFIANPLGNGNRLCKTGDRGRYLPDGKLEILGRVDNQVKIRGFKVELSAIDTAISFCPTVNTSVVLASKDDNETKQVVAYIVPESTVGFDISYKCESSTKEEISIFVGDNVAKLVEEIRNVILNKLPDYMVPAFWIVLDKIPLTHNGKTDGRLLLTLNAKKRLLVNEYVAPTNEIEKKLCDIWKEILHLDQVGINDNFFKIGGDSLKAVKVVGAVNNSLFSDIKVIDIFDKKNITELSKIVKDTLNKFKYKKYLIRETDTENLFKPFELTNVQQAYYFGRNGNFELGNISTHIYYEYSFGNLDLKKLEIALNGLINRHLCLRTVFENGSQRFLESVPHYVIELKKLRSQKELQEIRKKFSHKIYDVEKYPLFDVFVSKLDNKYILHFSSDMHPDGC